MLVVLDPGLFATVQDLGRPGHGALGVAVSGAADDLSLRAGNRLVANDDGAAAVEWTLIGGAWRFERETWFALAGAALPARLAAPAESASGLRPGGPGADVPGWTAVRAPAGAVLTAGATTWGARTYLCVRGGIDVPSVLGSRATHVAAGLGGFAGRALRAGDRLPLGHGSDAAGRRLSPEAVRALEARLRAPTLRATDGSHAHRFDAASARLFWGAPYAVTDQGDRTGVRLLGPRLDSPGAGTLPTEPLPLGAVEVPGNGQPLVLLKDGPPTGGYPVLACVAAVDHPRLGQLRPHERVAFTRVTLDEARAAYREGERAFETLVPAR